VTRPGDIDYRRPDQARKLRDDFDHLPGQSASQRRIVKHSHAIFPAFDSLEIGFNHEAAIAYLEEPSKAVKLPDDQRGRLTGLVLAFGMTCVEADRERAGRTLDEFDAWLSFRPEFAEALTAFRSAFGTNTGCGRETPMKS